MIITPEITLRLFSNDQYVLDKVLYSNFYRVKRIPENSVIVDVGAGIGTFSVQMAILGAARVYAYEPLKSNYKLLLSNVEAFGDVVNTSNSAVLFQNNFLNVNHPEFQEEGKYYDFNTVDIENDKRPADRVPCHTLDTVLKNIKEPAIQILKINTGFHELDILKNCGAEIKRVKHICGETSSDDIKLIETTIEHLKTMGFTDSWFLKTDENTNLFVFSQGNSEEQFKIKD